MAPPSARTVAFPRRPGLPPPVPGTKPSAFGYGDQVWQAKAWKDVLLTATRLVAITAPDAMRRALIDAAFAGRKRRYFAPSQR